MQFTDATLAYKLYTSGLNVPTIATLLGFDRTEVEQAIEFSQDHGPSFTGDNDDWLTYNDEVRDAN